MANAFPPHSRQRYSTILLQAWSGISLLTLLKSTACSINLGLGAPYEHGAGGRDSGCDARIAMEKNNKKKQLGRTRRLHIQAREGGREGEIKKGRESEPERGEGGREGGEGE